MNNRTKWDTKRKIEAILIISAILILVPSLLVTFWVPAFDSVESPPIIFTDCTSGQRVIVYHSLVTDDNITIGEVGLTWDLYFSDENENYRFYTLEIHHHVSGAIGEGLIKSGYAFLNLTTSNQSIYQCSEEHGEGATEVNLIANNSWGGDIQMYFTVLPGYEGFRPQNASNVVTLNAIIRTHLNANISFSLTFDSEWMADTDGGLFFNGTEKLLITINRDIFYVL